MTIHQFTKGMIEERRATFNSGLESMFAHAKEEHPGLAWDSLYPMIETPNGGPVDRLCEDCAKADPGCGPLGCAVVPIIDISTGLKVDTCRCVVNALRGHSRIAEHAESPMKLCYGCIQRKDRYGLINTSMHKVIRIADFEARCDAGLITIEDSGKMAIHDLAHTPVTHCPGCIEYRHHQCPRAGVCSDFVDRPDAI